MFLNKRSPDSNIYKRVLKITVDKKHKKKR